jgi:hypothetical protein
VQHDLVVGDGRELDGLDRVAGQGAHGAAQGRSRLSWGGLDHQRPENRHAGVAARDSRLGEVGAGRGQHSSTAAAMAATTSGSGWSSW